MPSYMTFRPPLGGSVARVEIDDFTLGTMRGRGADGVKFGHFFQYINEPKKFELHAMTLTVSAR